MATIQRRYSDEQRAAIADAWCRRRIRPASRIVDLAAAGQLELDGRELPAFELRASSAKAIGERAERQARALGERARQLPAADAVETFRQDLAGAIDEQLRHVRALQSRGRHGQVKGAELAALGRAVRELAAVPIPGSATPAPAPQRQRGADGRRHDGTVGAELADQLRAAVEPGRLAAADHLVPAAPAQLEPGSLEHEHGSSSAGAASDDDGSSSSDDDGSAPGSYARAAIAELRASSSSPG